MKVEKSLIKDDVFSLTPLTNNKGGQKLIDNELADKLFNMLHNQVEYGCDRVMMKRDLETAYWGNKSTGSIWGKVYNKTKQVKVKNDDDTPLLWIENGWNGKDEVVRVEFSMRRDFLKTMDDVVNNEEEYFMRNVIKAVSNDLQSSHHQQQYLHRRMKLGIA
jgi:hypothetical protein